MSEKKPRTKPAEISKEAMSTMISKGITDLNETATEFKALVESIRTASTYDISLGTIQSCKDLSAKLAASKARIDEIRKVMLLRAKTKMRELERGL
jgi:hypothetical protein